MSYNEHVNIKPIHYTRGRGMDSNRRHGINGPREMRSFGYLPQHNRSKKSVGMTIQSYKTYTDKFDLYNYNHNRFVIIIVHYRELGSLSALRFKSYLIYFFNKQVSNIKSTFYIRVVTGNGTFISILSQEY